MEAYAGRGALGRSARKAVARGERTRLFEIMAALCAAAASGRAPLGAGELAGAIGAARPAEDSAEGGPHRPSRRNDA
jgi:hypothetical protein